MDQPDAANAEAAAGPGAVAGIAPAPGVYPFQGAWAAEGQSCGASPDDPDGPTVITPDAFVRGGDACGVLSVVQGAQGAGPGAYAVTLSCGAGPGAFQATASLTVSGDTLEIAGEEGAATLTRCEPPEAGE